MPPDYGFDFVTIGDTGNVAYEGGPFGQLAGRGSVNYEYRMATMEISAAQWLEFINIFSPQIGTPFWGQLNITAPIVPVGINQFALNGAPEVVGQYPVLGISWRQAAMYVNWLNNDKATDLWAIMDGAYDVSTFGFEQGTGYTDQHTHHPDARYWIPTLDEWMKAVYYDPNRYGDDLGGWWDQPGSSNDPLMPGLPGVGQTNGGEFPGVFDVPLGSYGVTSPWGLLDASGGASEWTEEITYNSSGPEGRIHNGSYADMSYFGNINLDAAWQSGWSLPSTGEYAIGIRVASSIPSPAAWCALGLPLLMTHRRRR